MNTTKIAFLVLIFAPDANSAQTIRMSSWSADDAIGLVRSGAYGTSTARNLLEKQGTIVTITDLDNKSTVIKRVQSRIVTALV